MRNICFIMASLWHIKLSPTASWKLRANNAQWTGILNPYAICCSVFSFEGVMEHTPFETTYMATRLCLALSVRPQTHDKQDGPATLLAIRSVCEDKISTRYLKKKKKKKLWDSSVGILTRLRSRWTRNLCLFPAEAGDFLLTASRQAVGPTQPPMWCVSKARLVS
jgi:hypothetical protein